MKASNASTPGADATLIPLLHDGDRRMVRGVDGVIVAVEKKPALFAQLIEGMSSDDPLVRMRCADAVEKLTFKHPDWLQPYKRILLNTIAKSEQQEVRWHGAQVLPRLKLTSAERRRAVSLMRGYLDDKSKIVRTFALQAMADLAMQDAALQSEVIEVIQLHLAADTSAAVQSRGRKLLKQLQARKDRDATAK